MLLSSPSVWAIDGLPFFDVMLIGNVSLTDMPRTKVRGRCALDRCVPTLDRILALGNLNSYLHKIGLPLVPCGPPRVT
jgi:hypothetical protein